MTEHRAGSKSFPATAKAVLAALVLLWFAAALFVFPAAPYIIDGFIYWAMIDAAARDGSLFIENGFPEFRSEAQQLLLMVPVGDRLTAQYPGGWGVVAAPAYLVGGLRGVVLINVAASAVTLALIWLIARTLFDDRQVAAAAALIYGFATIAADYVIAVWPHAISTLTVTAAIYSAARAWRGDQLGWASAAGLAIGLGINLRVDVILALPPLLLWLVGTSQRPFRMAGAVLMGLVPGLAVATLINALKFGVIFPITYGRSEGAVSLSHYGDLLILAVVILAFGMLLGVERVRHAVYRPAAAGVIGLLLAAVALTHGPSGDIVGRILGGLWVLVIDFQDYPFETPGLERQEDGTLLAFDFFKKALLQSMPFAAVLILLVPRLFHGPGRAGVALGFLVIAAVLVPFAYSSWHGGMSNSMRYFLHAAPMLAVLAALAICHLRAEGTESSAGLVLAAVVVIVLGFGWPASQGVSIEQILATDLVDTLVLATAATCVLAVIPAAGLQGAARGAARFLVFVGLGLGWVHTYLVDVPRSQEKRIANVLGAEVAASLPADAVVLTNITEGLGMRLNRPPAITAQADFERTTLSEDLAGLISQAFAAGRPVISEGVELTTAILRAGAAAEATFIAHTPGGNLFRLSPP